MDGRINVNQPLNPVQRPNHRPNKEQQTEKKSNDTSFKDVLADKIKEKSGVEFSNHARQRINSRNIELGEEQLDKLNDAVNKAEDKGARESLIMVEGVAYVVSVENKTVITAIDNENVKENVFTNIDSAVFM
ncbi:MAG: TIGR02530 family flagellar biosynthesis protein [Bacillota bacterium]